MLTRINNFFYTLLRKNTTQKQRYLGFWWEKRNLIPFFKSVKIFALDYENYLTKNKFKDSFYLYFPKKDKEEIDYFLKIYDKVAHYDFLKREDFKGRWEVFEKYRKKVGKNLKFNFILNIYELYGFKSIFYPDSDVFPDDYNLHFFKKNKYSVCLDLGAYIGDTAYLINKYLKPQKVYAFEPDPDNLKILKQNIRLNQLEGKVIPVPLASSDKNGFVYFRNQGAGSEIINEKKGKHTLRIKTITIDSFVEKNKIKKVDLIKMDIEGAEFDTLKGAVKTLKRDKPDLIIAIYHKGEHLFEIPPYLKKIVPEYKFRFFAFNQASPIIERFIAASVKKI